MDEDNNKKRAASKSPAKDGNKENDMGTVKRAQVAGSVNEMMEALFSAAKEKDPEDVKAITFTMTPTIGGEVKIAATDPVFEQWKKDHCREEYDSEDSEAANFCSLCLKSPCVWIKNEEHVRAIVASMEGQPNLAIRFQLYSFFTRSLHGVLGKGKRIPLPCCCGRKIREEFPHEEGESFVGFKPGTVNTEEP